MVLFSAPDMQVLLCVCVCVYVCDAVDYMLYV